MNKRKLREAGFVVVGGRGDPGSCEKLRLATLSNFKGWQGTVNLLFGDERELHFLAQLIRSFVWVGGIIHRRRAGSSIGGRPIKTLLVSEVKTAQNINLSLSSHCYKTVG